MRPAAAPEYGCCWVAAGVSNSLSHASPSGVNSGGWHATAIPLGRGSPGARATGRSPQSIAGCSARSSRHLCGVHRFEYGVAADKMPDGTVVQVCYQGELPSSATLPARGRFTGEEWSTGNTSWIWMTPAGASFPSWVDP
jgi:hypothetical protein